MPLVLFPAKRDSASDGQPFFIIWPVRGPAWSGLSTTPELTSSLGRRLDPLKLITYSSIYGE